jgi:hypothetical protein
MITAERLRELLSYDPETGVFTRLVPRSGRGARVGGVAGRVSTKGYREISVGIRYKAHHLAWLYVTGKWPRDQIDHRNCCKDDNRWINLRLADNFKNARNRTISSANSSGFKGVSRHKRTGKWQANIAANGKQFYLGLYTTPEEAALVYATAACGLFGEFARATWWGE